MLRGGQTRASLLQTGRWMVAPGGTGVRLDVALVRSQCVAKEVEAISFPTFPLGVLEARV